MDPAELDQLKRLLATLREPPPTKEQERWAVELFRRFCPPDERRSQGTGGAG